jgi:hypothetical protein
VTCLHPTLTAAIGLICVSDDDVRHLHNCTECHSTIARPVSSLMLTSMQHKSARRGISMDDIVDEINIEYRAIRRREEMERIANDHMLCMRAIERRAIRCGRTLARWEAA